MEDSATTLLALVLLGLLLASRNNAYPVFLPVWGALINGAVTLVRSRCFFTATGGPDGWHNLLPGWGSLDQGSRSPLRVLFITVSQLSAVFEAPFVSLSACEPPSHLTGKAPLLLFIS